ncbi:MAG: zinc ribbon domain-containing protein [Merdibacter sp.]
MICVILNEGGIRWKSERDCPKCGCHEYYSDRSGNRRQFCQIVDAEQKFITVSCRECGYTELHRAVRRRHEHPDF